ncbi:MAG: hypothetical protein LBL57_04130 [Tannerella sp.]|jgi:hypothetical protein|nr:hypothetical protein [Tannerella sp.]
MSTLKLLKRALTADLIELKQYVLTGYVLWRQSMRLKIAMSLADLKQRATNRRYFVMSMEVSGGEKLVSINRNDLIRIRRRKWLPKNFSHLDLENQSWYQTELKRNNSLTRQERQKAIKKYQKYLKSQPAKS